MSPKFASLLIAICSAAALLSGCGGETETADPLLGLRSVCFPDEGGAKTYVVSPGFLPLEDGQRGRITGVTLEGASSDDLELLIASSGVVAGDATEFNSDMVLTPAMNLELAGPGEWPIVYRLTTRGEDIEASVTGFEFEVDGVRYETTEFFELSVKSTC